MKLEERDAIVAEMRQPKIHCLKTWPQYYAAVLDGSKTFEIRRNDRDFAVGDVLVLQEFDPAAGSYTKEMIAMRITYITDFQQQAGFVCMGMERYLAEHAQPASAAPLKRWKPKIHPTDRDLENAQPAERSTDGGGACIRGFQCANCLRTALF
jgi:hypothetical protein